MYKEMVYIHRVAAQILWETCGIPHYCHGLVRLLMQMSLYPTHVHVPFVYLFL